MNTHLPRTIPEYLEQLRRALAGADPAMIQDALYDAEEYLRSELAENPGRSEAEVIAAVASSYGAPDEVADIYRDTEATVQTALRSPVPRPRKSLAGRFFGVVADPRTYASLFYMVLALATGVFYFTWVVAGFSTAAGLSITVVGIPLLILFFGSVRVLSLVEGRIVEVMLGERMPRRPLYSARGRSIWQRIGDMFTDPRTWSTLLYMLLMLPLGVAYFTLAVTLLAVGLSFVLAPIAVWTGLAEEWFDMHDMVLVGIDGVALQGWELVLMLVAGVLLLFATLHLARLIGRGHGLLAKHLLVKTAQYS
ncbi:sensor domain-containing protein [Luteimonas sp. Sa2BVA3]|uniref:Sensor domain-containing protein n=1 Tax=Luteimonas colneyensis TaxID=2762230 RepID=A0ABR8UL83_9GAMM|nr:sensor domain-containing protein [Luteimonas colneyensis]MBD7988782.1 sensor domain-containing protein [Luteimonas colneyensis]